MIAPQNVLRHEFIGRTVTAYREDGGPRHMGVIVEETRDTFTLKTPSKDIRLTKKDHVFEVDLPRGARVRVAGALLAGRPEDRIKKKIRITYA